MIGQWASALDSVILGLLVRTSLELHLRALCHQTHFASNKKIISVEALHCEDCKKI